MEEQEKMVLFSQNIKIVEYLQGAWGRYSAAMETHRYKNGTCLLITAAHCNIFSPLREDCGVYNKAGNQEENHTGLQINSSQCRVESIGGYISAANPICIILCRVE